METNASVRRSGAHPARLGKYELLRHLATGGMAEIWLARAQGIQGFEKLVVVKTLLPRVQQDPALVSMFLDEARVAATLHHPNIVQVYDIGVAADDEYFFSMEFVYGQDLSHLLRRAAETRKPPSLDTALTIVIALCAALHHAHEKEGADGKPLHLVHRDVSPQNVLISYDGAVKLMDFGIAKAANNSTKTRDGTLKGKIAYMSPEQGTSGKVDRRSDIFSLAILLWELTTFRRLYRADSDFETLRKIIQQDAPKPSKHRPDFPPALERIILKGLKRNPAERYQSAEEMQLDLEAFAREQRLVISSVSMSRYIRELFHDRVSAWARAQESGKSFTDFLVEGSQIQEGSAVTADTWIAPGTEPTSTTSVGEPEISVSDEEAPPAYPIKNNRARTIAISVVAACVLGLVGWRLMAGSGETARSEAAPAKAEVAAPVAAPEPPKPADPELTKPAEPPPTTAGSGAGSSEPVAVTPPPVAPPTITKRPIKPIVKPVGKPPVPVKPTKPTKPVREDLDSPFPN